jgi:hypothetical protein
MAELAKHAQKQGKATRWRGGRNYPKNTTYGVGKKNNHHIKDFY